MSRSWVTEADGHPDFPLENLPLGIFSPVNGEPRPGIAIGDHILDLPAAAAEGLLPHAPTAPTLNAFLAQGAAPRRALRAAVSALLTEGSPAESRATALLHRAAACTLHLPATIGDYTDFYAGLYHAEAVGRLFRPDAPLLPNYKHVPIGYHGRASSIIPSGEPFHRPNGQRKPGTQEAPDFGPCRNLDFELEVGIWIGPGTPQGTPIPIAHAQDHIAGYCLLNDWSARDIQAWEYQPLGPFLAKSFATTISPWIITPEALAPYRAPQPARPAADPRPLPYLWDETDQHAGALNITLEAALLTERMRQANQPPHRLSQSNALHAYWTAAQMVAHHASGGCNLRPGDLFGTGTLSGPTPEGCGSLLELNQGGTRPITLPNGETRRFLEDGDEILLTARAGGNGLPSIGFGECRAMVLPART